MLTLEELANELLDGILSGRYRPEGVATDCTTGSVLAEVTPSDSEDAILKFEAVRP